MDNTANAAKKAPYKSREAGTDTTPISLKPDVWYHKFVPLSAELIKYDPFMELCRYKYDENMTFEQQKEFIKIKMLIDVAISLVIKYLRLL